MTTAGSEYSAFIAAQLSEERATKSSLETRGITVITTSGGLVTLLFGLVALATKAAQTYVLPDAARSLLVGAAGLLTLAGVFGLLTNFAFTYTEATVDGMRSLFKRDWDASQEQGQADIADTNITIISTARDRNGKKAILLRLAMGSEIAGVLLVAMAVINVLTA